MREKKKMKMIEEELLEGESNRLREKAMKRKEVIDGQREWRDTDKVREVGKDTEMDR